MNEICTIVVTYNRKELLKENIEALRKQNYKNFDILVVDNNSTDGTKEYIDEYIKNGDILYVNTKKNLGGSGGFQFGLKEAIKKNYKYVWLMDDDTIPTENSLSSLIEKKNLLNDEFSFLCSIVKFNENEICTMNIPVMDSKWIDYYYFIEKGLLKVKSCSFVSCFINIKVAKQIGLPIKEFFIYGDDAEYTERLSSVLPGFIDTNSIVNHKMKFNIGPSIVDADKDRINRAFYTYRNTLYIAKKKGIKDVFKYLIMWIYVALLVIFKSKKHKLKRLLVMMKGLAYGIAFNPKIEFVED